MEGHQGGLTFSGSHATSGPCWAPRWRCPWGSWMLGLKAQKLWTGDQSLSPALQVPILARMGLVPTAQGVSGLQWWNRGRGRGCSQQQCPRWCG